MKGNGSTKLLALVVVLVLFSVAALAFSVLNVLNIMSTKESITQQEITLESYNQKIARLESLKSRASEIEAEIEEYTQLLPIGMNQADVLTKLHNVFEQYQVQVSQVQINSAESVENGVSKVPVTFSATGDYNGVMLMLEDFSVTNPIANVDNITLTKGSGDINEVSFNVVVSFFYIDAN